jgi:hypothetical protein
VSVVQVEAWEDQLLLTGKGAISIASIRNLDEGTANYLL